MPEVLRTGWYKVIRFPYQPGLENAIPEWKTWIIKVFWDLPKEWDFSRVISEIELDINEIINSARILITVVPPGSVINVIVIHWDTEYKQAIVIWQSIAILSENTTRRMAGTLVVQ